MYDLVFYISGKSQEMSRTKIVIDEVSQEFDPLEFYNDCRRPKRKLLKKRHDFQLGAVEEEE
jgi:hypothetical protein